MDNSKRKYESLSSGSPRRKSQKSQTQYICDHENCTSTFRCHFNLVRHKQSIHGSKRGCPYESCNYSTGRMDKMKEHIKRMHKFTRSEPRPAPRPVPVQVPVTSVENFNTSPSPFHHTPPTHSYPFQRTPSIHFSNPSYSPQTPPTPFSAPSFTSPPQTTFLEPPMLDVQPNMHIYPNSEKSSLEVHYNPTYYPFFGDVLFGRLSIGPHTNTTTSATIPNTLSSISASDTDTSLRTLSSNPCSPELDLNGLGGWMGECGMGEGRYEEDGDDESDGMSNADCEFERDEGAAGYMYAHQPYVDLGVENYWP